MDLNKPIPKVKFPTIHEYSIVGVDEAIVSVSKAGIRVKSKYYEQCIAGSYADCYARKSVVDRLCKVRELLPNGYDIKVWDAYRPITIQQRLWNLYRADLRFKYKDESEEEIDKRTSFFVSKPSFDILNPSLHNTGGAVDLTLTDSDGNDLNMGTAFDDFTDAAWTNHFEMYEVNVEVQKNRRILYNAMLEVGFTNLPSEWWHYDYGTKFWGYFNGRDALYTGILDVDFEKRFPLM